MIRGLRFDICESSIIIRLIVKRFSLERILLMKNLGREIIRITFNSTREEKLG